MSRPADALRILAREYPYLVTNRQRRAVFRICEILPKAAGGIPRKRQTRFIAAVAVLPFKLPTRGTK